MIVVIPNQIDGLSKIESKILKIDTKTLESRRNNTLVILEIPKFKIESKLELNKALMTVGSKMFQIFFLINAFFLS